MHRNTFNRQLDILTRINITCNDNIVQAIIVCGYYDNPILYVRFMYV